MTHRIILFLLLVCTTNAAEKTFRLEYTNPKLLQDKSAVDTNPAYIPNVLTLEVLKTACPELSVKAIRAFDEVVTQRDFTKEQATKLMWNLYAQGETLLSEQQTKEYVALYWKAIGALTVQEQAFISQANIKIAAGEGFSYSDQEKINTLMAKAFSKLSDKDHMRFLDIRCNALSLALHNSEKTKAAYGEMTSTSQPPTKPIMSRTEKENIMAELISKGMEQFSEDEKFRFNFLQMKQPSELTPD